MVSRCVDWVPAEGGGGVGSYELRLGAALENLHFMQNGPKTLNPSTLNPTTRNPKSQKEYPLSTEGSKGTPLRPSGPGGRAIVSGSTALALENSMLRSDFGFRV